MTPEEKTVAEESCDAAHIERQEPTRTQAEWEAWARDIELRLHYVESALFLRSPRYLTALETKRLEEQP